MEIIFWLVFCVAVGYFANSKGRSGPGWGLLAVVISPLLAGIILALIKDLTIEENVEKVRMEHQHLKDRVVSNEKETAYRLGRVEGEVSMLQSNNSSRGTLAQGSATKLLTNDTKLCPACAEVIKKAAIRCKHCGIMINEMATRTCPYCAENVKPTDTRCNHCNSVID